MHTQSRRHLALHARHEGEKILLRVGRPALVLHIAGAHIEPGEQRRGPVALVVVREGPGPAVLERHAGLRAIECLNLTLLIHGEDHGALRRIHIEADDIAQFHDERGIGRDLEVRDPVRLQAIRAPQPRDRRLIPARRLAIVRVLQCVPPSGGASFRIFATIRASSAASSCRGRPERGRSATSASRPSVSYRFSHKLTVGRDTPTAAQIASPAIPSADASTIFARSTTRCGVVRARTHASTAGDPHGATGYFE